MATSPRTKNSPATQKRNTGTGRRRKAGSKRRAAARSTSRNADAAVNDLDKLRDDIMRLSQSVAGLLTTRAGDARDLVTETASGLYETGVGYAEDAETQVRGMASDLAKQVERNPLAAVGIVFGVGYIIGLMRRR